MELKTAFYDIHKSLNAKIISFAGFLMPVQYEGIIAEHLAVRNSVGVFDVSHMGEFIVKGKDALPFIQKCTTNDASKLKPGKVQYSAMCYENGGIVDDLLVYCFDDYYMLVVNAANIQKDFQWLSSNLNGFDAELINDSNKYSLLAVQGKNSLSTLQKLTETKLDELKYYTYANGKIAGIDAVISRTGYTGEKIGFEIYCSSEKTQSEIIWNEIFNAGSEFNIKPVGLGARDTLRLEAAYCLYGNDIDSNTNTIEAGLGWITKTNKGSFNGKSKIEQVLNDGPSRKLVGFIVEGKLPARKGYEIYADSSPKGFVTSGSFSPCLNKNIGLGYIDANYSAEGTYIKIKIRNDFADAQIVKTPFVKKD